MASGDLNNAVVIVQLAKVKVFQGDLHIQNCMNCTKLIFNPNCAEGQLMRNSIVVNPDSPQPLTLTQLHAEPKLDPKDDFLYNTQRSTIQGLKDCQREAIYVVLGKVTQIMNPQNWWYTACSCNKSVFADSNMYFCSKCDKHVVKVFQRYCIKVRVMDSSDAATFVIFDKDANLLFNKSCAEMLQSHVNGVLPGELSAIVDTSILFKVEIKPEFNSMFEQTFKVRKLCTDENIIAEFKQKWDKEEAAFQKNSNELTSLSVLLDKGAGSSQLNGVMELGLDAISTKLVSKGKEKIFEGDIEGVSEDLIEKFELAKQNVDDSEESVSEFKDKERFIIPLATEMVVETGPPSEQKAIKRASPTGDEVSNDVPLKQMLRRKIKIEKN